MNLKFLNSLKATYISCGEDFTAVLTFDGGVFTFGAGMYGQLGHGQIGHEYLPRKIPDLMGSQVTQIACGRCHTIVYLSSNKRLYSFGLGGNGQLGVKSSTNNTSPSYVQIEMDNVKNNLNLSNCEESKFNSHALFAISAGGDQSFLISTHVTDKVQPQDYRSIASQHEILTINVLDQLNNKNPLVSSKKNVSNPTATPKLTVNMHPCIENSPQL